jgi:hypothetical protein
VQGEAAQAVQLPRADVGVRVRALARGDLDEIEADYAPARAGDGQQHGPEISLPEGTDEVEFDLRACLDGNDVNAGLYMRVHAIFRWLGARDERDEDATRWVGLALLGDPQQAYEDGLARPGGTNLDVVVVQSQACSTPLKVVFTRAGRNPATNSKPRSTSMTW